MLFETIGEIAATNFILYILNKKNENSQIS